MCISHAADLMQPERACMVVYHRKWRIERNTVGSLETAARAGTSAIVSRSYASAACLVFGEVLRRFANRASASSIFHE